MPYVLDPPSGLTARATAFLRAHGRAGVVPVAYEHDDIELRQRLFEAFGPVPGDPVALLRELRQRYAGLSWPSPFFGEQVFLDPLLDPEPGDPRIEFRYAVHPTTAGCPGAHLLLDGTVVIGRAGEPGVAAFPSLDHLIETDALLHSLRGAPELDPAAVDGPAVRPVPEASGPTSRWWTDGRAVRHLDTTWVELGDSPLPTDRAWALPTGLLPAAPEGSGRLPA
ncbi:hypothetical protein [Streptomyces sp. TLI_171]|uniref:hypothetical protein n=1 Tax=Streptomyces sp. TLI_171 TaxID=1938859 RepID=UPI000C185F6B|nr:hypothetical protein [Streptomyces sp. TLI_171]